MKISIALSLLILAIGGMLGWQDHQRLVAVRASHDKLAAEAAAAGIVLDESRADDAVRITKREREDKEAIARQTAVDFIAFARKIEAVEKKGGSPNDEMQQDILDFMDRMMALDSSQLKVLIAEFRAAPDLKDETREGLIGFSIMTLANDHPQAALTLFTESSDLFEDNRMAGHLVKSSLAKWAKDDPLAALEWARANGKKHPDLVNDDAKRGIISGAAANDPKLAFSLISELDLKQDGVRSVADAATTPAQRTATLAALTGYLATLTDTEAKKTAEHLVIGELTQNAAKDGFEAGTRWITEAKFTPEQLAMVGSGVLTHVIKREETGKWIEWMGRTLPEKKANDGISNLVSNWTRNDYQAAGTWLATTPAGPAKEASVRAYAETVAEYEPEIATQWALTLPPGKSREQTLHRIYQEWPQKDEASKKAAEAFAKEHGID
ncbi:MAG: hypothetical protein V4640_02455 [Verrucomicrobiota bacterium]